MPVEPDLVGTATLTSGSTAFTWSGPSLTAHKVQEGDVLFLPAKGGLQAVVASITSPTAGTITNVAPASIAGAAQPARIRFQSDLSRANGKLSNLLEVLGPGAMQRSVFDPQGVEADAFDRANHRGRSPMSSVIGLIDALRETPSARARGYVLGRQWTNRPSAEDSTWIGIDYSPEQGRYVAVAASGTNRVMTSTDGGRTWTPVAVTTGTWFHVRWVREIGRWIVTGDNGTTGAMYSSNGTTWVPVATPGGIWVKSAYSPKLGKLVAVSRGNPSTNQNAGQAMVSTNGASWELMTLPVNNDWLAIEWADDLEKFVVTGSPMVDGSDNAPVVLLSEDGATWVSAALGNLDHWWQVKWVRELGLLVAVANNYSTNRVMTSPDGTIWTPRSPPAGTDDRWNDLAWSPSLGLLVAIANAGTNRVMYSTNGVSWSAWSPPSGAPADQAWRAITWSEEDQQFVAVGTSGAGNRVMTTATAHDFVPLSEERGRITLADDAVAAIPLPDLGGQMIAFSCTPGNPGSAAFPSFIAQVRSNVSTVPALVGATSSASMEMTTGALTGTTGTDGRLTLSSDGTNFYMENRLGAARTWNWRVVA